MGLKTVQLLFKGLQYRRESKYERGGTPPLSKIIAKHNDRARMQSSTRYVKARIEELRQITWEQQPITDLAYGQRLYDEGIAIANRAEGDHKKLGAAIHCFVQCPPALAYSGAAEVMRRLSYVGGSDSVPLGIQEAGRYSSLAVESDPNSAEAWIMRACVFCAAPDRLYKKIARYAIEQGRRIAPTHPRLTYPVALYAKIIGDTAGQEVAFLSAIDTLPTPPERLATLKLLASSYTAQGHYEKAINTYQRALTEFPEGSAWTWHNYSLALERVGRYQEALESSDRALTFFEFSRARKQNDELRIQLGLPPRHI